MQDQTFTIGIDERIWPVAVLLLAIGSVTLYKVRSWIWKTIGGLVALLGAMLLMLVALFLLRG